MTKFLCTKCSGFYNLDCTLETNSPLGVPDRCPFGVLKCTITWEIIDDAPLKTVTAPEPQPASQPACVNQTGNTGIRSPVTLNDGGTFGFYKRNSCPDA